MLRGALIYFIAAAIAATITAAGGGAGDRRCSRREAGLRSSRRPKPVRSRRRQPRPSCRRSLTPPNRQSKGASGTEPLRYGRPFPVKASGHNSRWARSSGGGAWISTPALSLSPHWYSRVDGWTAAGPPFAPALRPTAGARTFTRRCSSGYNCPRPVVGRSPASIGALALSSSSGRRNPERPGPRRRQAMLFVGDEAAISYQRANS